MSAKHSFHFLAHINLSDQPSISVNSTAGRWVLFSTILASAMAFIDSTALNVILPSLQEKLDAKGSELFWVLNAYLLMLASFILVSGSLGDKLGRKKVYMIGIGVFILSSAACGLSPTIEWLIAFRAIQGLGGALMIPGSLSIISATFARREKGKAIGTWSAATTIVTVGGPILGGALADAGLWRLIFFINLPIGILSLLALHFKVPESRDEDARHRLDYEGAGTLVVSLALLTFGFLRAPELGWGHWQSWGALSTGLMMFLVFLRLESRKRHPMVRLALFRERNFSGANLLTFLLYAGLSAGMLFLTLNLIQVQGYSQLQAGLTLLPFTILMASIARWAGSLVDRYGPRWLLVVGPALAGCGFWLLSAVGLTRGPEAFWTTFLPGIFVFGLGMSFTVAPLTTTVMGSVEDQHAGTASGVNNSMTRISGVMANAILGALAILFFETSLQEEISALSLSTEDRQAIVAQASELGNARVPASVAAAQEENVKQLIKTAFVDTFSRIQQICAVLAWLAALISLILIRNHAAESDTS
jgi:EmrB/QacA subfamily drug resistance transporter